MIIKVKGLEPRMTGGEQKKRKDEHDKKGGRT